MRFALLVFIAAILLAHTSTGAREPVISLSSDPTDTTVESLKTGRTMIPGIDIYADGLVQVRRYDGTEATRRVDKQAVDHLLHSLEASTFYTVTEDAFHAELEKSGVTERVVITDCPVWTLTTRASGQTHSTKFYGLFATAKVYPKSQQLRKLIQAVEKIYATVGDKL